jgi:hypothetical protein
MREPDNRSSADDRAAQSEKFVDRREATGEAVKLFAKYTAPAMLVVLMASSGKAIAVTGSTGGIGGSAGGH